MAMTAQPTSGSSSILGAANTAVLSAAQFREIHKNTWLKRLTADGKKITVGPKKSDRSWVVFCVHDDTDAILEGYAEPRQAPSHNPEWFLSMQSTQHISHSLMPNSNEFEFVITLSNEVVRFHAMSWEIMQEWVDTLRSKLREMKILSPRENLYTKLPEARLPLLPTRDPTSPLPAPPPVPAAIVPGVEPVVVPQSMLQAATTSSSESMSRNAVTTPPHIPAMSNTLTQNLLNMLSDPISAYSEQLQAVESSGASHNIPNRIVNEQLSTSLNDLQLETRSGNETEDCLSPLLRPVNGNESLSVNNTPALKTKRHSADNARNMDNVTQCDRLIPRPHTSRSQSAGAADKSRNSRQLATISSSSSSAGGTTISNESSTNNETSRKASETNITALEITTNLASKPTITTPTDLTGCDDDENTKSNITIIQVSTDNNDTQQVPKLPLKSNPTTSSAEVFQFPETSNDDEITKTTTSSITTKTKKPEYRSNVQLIPSSNSANSSTIKVLGDVTTTTSTKYSKPSPKNGPSKQLQKTTKTTTTTAQNTASTMQTESSKITTVHVGGETGGSTTSVSVYGTCFSPQPPHEEVEEEAEDASPQSTPKLHKKIILSANTSGITNITVDSNAPTVHSKLKIKSKNIETTPDVSVSHCNIGNVHYEKVFLSSSTPIASVNSISTTAPTTATITNNSAATTTTVNTYVSSPTSKLLNKSNDYVSPIHHKHISISREIETNSTSPSTSIPSAASKRLNKPIQSASITTTTTTTTNSIIDVVPPTLPQRIGGSPALQRRAIALRPPNMLTRGQTEAVITTRPSRRDFYFNNGVRRPKNPNSSHHISNKSINKSQTAAVNNNENGEPTLNNEAATTAQQTATNRTLSEVIEQRRRSSSTSDARIQRGTTRGANNNEFAASNRTPNALRIQQPPQPFRNVENSLSGGAAGMSPTPTGSSGTKRMTLREQQVMQLRREIIHPGGVRLQLRRKDCVGSIAWVEAFGAVWVAGWKQKEHPVLYNALHIGDQLLSIAGVTITSATEANKIIRNANTLFVEVLIRRMPFARGYAIRRDREGQCLGLIRDGNTATIVDVVPNCLAARHGLPPKAQSCDGASLTFWVLTEINGRPLNLFFKDNEIRDRLNSVGRDISILVQPSDLITKLKKQLKSLRGYKDYLVQ